MAVLVIISLLLARAVQIHQLISVVRQSFSTTDTVSREQLFDNNRKRVRLLQQLDLYKANREFSAQQLDPFESAV